MERNSIDPADMKIGQAVRYSELTTWKSEDGLAWCTRCGIGPDSPRYPADEVMVVRHYKTNSTAGTWVWLCDTHFQTAKPWKTDALAPAALRP